MKPGLCSMKIYSPRRSPWCVMNYFEGNVVIRIREQLLEWRHVWFAETRCVINSHCVSFTRYYSRNFESISAISGWAIWRNNLSCVYAVLMPGDLRCNLPFYIEAILLPNNLRYNVMLNIFYIEPILVQFSCILKILRGSNLRRTLLMYRQLHFEVICDLTQLRIAILRRSNGPCNWLIFKQF